MQSITDRETGARAATFANRAARGMNGRCRDSEFWSRGGSGFLGSHLCERLLNEGHEVVCLDNFFTGSRANVEHLLDNHRFELVRHDVTEPLTMEVDEIYPPRLPRLADPLPAQPGAHHPHRGRGDAQHARPGARGAGAHPDRLDVARSTAIRSSTRSARATGATSTRSARAPATTRASAAPRRWPSRTRASTRVEVRIARIFNTYGPRMHENDGRVVSNFVVQALRNEPITIYGEGQQTRSFCYATDLIEGFMRLMASPHGVDPVNLGNPRETTVLRAGRDDAQAGRSRSREIVKAPLPKDDPTRRKPDIARAQELLGGWAPQRAARRGAGGDHRRLQAPPRVSSGRSRTRQALTRGAPRRRVAARSRALAR